MDLSKCTGIFLIFVGLIIVQVFLKIRRPVKGAAKNILVGVLALLIINLTSFITTVTLPISLLSLGISAVMGVPGITLMLAINLI